MSYEADRATDFIKYAVIDMNLFRRMIDCGRIIVDVDHQGTSRIENDCIIAGYNVNADHSSEFAAFDIAQLMRCFGAQMVLLQKGFV